MSNTNQGGTKSTLDDPPPCSTETFAVVSGYGICSTHHQRYQAKFGLCFHQRIGEPLEVHFQAHFLVARLGLLKDLLQSICPPQYGLTRMGCWCLEAAISLDDHTSGSETLSLDLAGAYLRERKIVTGDGLQAQAVQRYFVFCLIGLMTCLYQPAVADQDKLLQSYAVITACPTTNHRFWCFFTSQLSAREPSCIVPALLSRLGNVLPLTDKEGKASVETDCLLDTTQFNAETLFSVLKIKVAWTDILGAHLDFDADTNTLFLFRQPTVCFASSLPEASHTMLQCCMRGDLEDWQLRGLLQEILLSIHIIFCLDAKSRSRFDEDAAFWGIPAPQRDPLLRRLCHNTWTFDFPDHQYLPKRIFQVQSDFPWLGPKLAYLNRHVVQHQPRSLTQLWKDKRNTLQWWTFWAVIVFGLVATSLTVVQTVLAGIQVQYAAKQGAR